MKRLMKAALILAAAGALAAAAAAVAIRKALPPEKARALVVERAGKALKREVRLKGMSVGLMRGAVIEGLEVSEAPDFSKGVFASAAEIALKPRLLPLLRGEVLVDQVSVSGLRLTLVRRKDGSLALPGAESPAPGAKPAAGPTKLEVSRARLSDAQVVFVDEGRGQRWEASDLDARVSSFALDRPFYLEASGRVKGALEARPVDARFAVDGRFDPARGDLKKASAKLKKLEVEESGLLLKASGSARGEGPSADLEVAVSHQGDEALSGSLKAAAPGADGFSEAEFDLAGGKGLSALLQRFGAPGLALPPDLKVKGKARVSADEAVVSSLTLESGWGRAQGQGRAKGLRGKKPVFAGEADLDLSLPALSAGSLPPGTLPAGLKALPPLGLRGAVKVDGEDASLTGLKVRTPWGPAELDGTVRALGSEKPLARVRAAFKLDLPAFAASDLPPGLLPAGLKVPPLGLEGEAKVDGEDASVTGLKVRTPWGPAQVDGTVRGLRSEKPAPRGTATFALDLPAWKSEDLPLPQVPPGLEVPAGRLEGKLEGGLEELKLRPLRVKIGGSDLEAEGSVRLKDAPSGALMLKCRSFVLDELTRLSPRTRELKLKGKGFFALAVTGPLSKPALGGKLQFSGLGASPAGVELSDFTGTVSFDDRRIDAPNIRGLLAGDQLSVDVTVRDYVKRPSVEVIAELVRLDLGKLLAAHQALKKPAAEAPAPKPGEAAAVPPVDAKGRITVGQVVHPNATANEAKISWELEGITPTFKELNGWAKLSSGSGRFQDLAGLASQAKLLKVAIFPLMVLQKIGIPGIFPNLDRLSYQEMAGDYAFQNGRMLIRESHLYATDLQASSVGSIDLPSERLDLTVTAQVGRVAPIDIGVTGTFAEPKAKPKIGKFLADPAKQLLENIFKR